MSREEEPLPARNPKKIKKSSDVAREEDLGYAAMVEDELCSAQQDDNDGMNMDRSDNEEIGFLRVDLEAPANKPSYKAALSGTKVRSKLEAIPFSSKSFHGDNVQVIGPSKEKPYPSVKLNPEFKHNLEFKWSSSLILKVLGKGIGYEAMEAKMHKLCNICEDYELIDLGFNFFILKLESEDLRMKILTEGPWNINGYYLLVQTWVPGFNPSLHTISSTIGWNSSTTPSNKTIKWVGWQAPPQGWIKLNTDASRCVFSGHTALGGVARDHEGKWLYGFYRNSHNSQIFCAELKGIREGLKLAWDKGHKNIIIESDSLSAVRCILQEEEWEARDGLLIEDCRNFLKRDWRCIILHTLREGNRVADRLAGLGQSIEENLIILINPLDCVCILLADDIRGVLLPRL